jgi:microcystin-dependent protein
MADPFVAEIRMFGGNFAPKGWATCDGQLLPISQNTALFSLVGTLYGGDGRSTFALPNLGGRAPMHAGSGPGLTNRSVGDTGGSETVTLSATALPAHAHALRAANAASDSSQPGGRVLAAAAGDAFLAAGTKTPTPMHGLTLSPTGGNAPHNNMQPYLTLNFIIALQGIFPPRS